MTGGRPKQVDPGTLYVFAHQLYWDLRRLEEGTSRLRFDPKEHERLTAAPKNPTPRLSDEQTASIEQVVEEEIRTGRLQESKKKTRVRDLRNNLRSATHETLSYVAGVEATKRLAVPGEPDVLSDLLNADNREQVLRSCESAFAMVEREVAPGIVRKVKWPNWPISVGSTLPHNLAKFASEFVAAKRDSRYPKSTQRPSTRLKQLWFLSRALAGAIFGVKTRTAINLVGSKRPEQIFEESRAGKSARKRTKRKFKS